MSYRSQLTTLLQVSVLWLLAGNVLAKNIGVIGTVYPIVETDARAVMQQALLQRQRSGELDQFYAKLQATLQQQLDRPPPVPGLYRTLQVRTWFVTPVSVRRTTGLTSR